MVRPGPPPDDLVVVLRATPGALQEAIADIAAAAIRSAAVYVVEKAGARHLLFGVSVFAVADGGNRRDVLLRFDTAPTYAQATVGALRSAGFRVIPTGGNLEHYDVQLVDGVAEEDDTGSAEVMMAAARLLAVAGPLRPNPAYAGAAPLTPEEP